MARPPRAYRITLPPEQEDLAAAALWELGTLGVELPAAPPGEVVLLAYFEDLDEAAVSGALAGLPGTTVSPTTVPDVDWVARFREGFRPFEAAGFHVVPAWDPAARPGGEVIVVDPGRAFGTGTHETTRLCLAALRRLAPRGPLGRTLDVGAGTGILGIAAARLGAGPVVALDVDPESVDSCRLHARLNRVELLAVLADGAAAVRPASFDVVFANVTAPVLEARAAEVAATVASRGRLVLSGFLREDAERLRDAYATAWPGSSPPASELLLDGEWAAWLLEGP